MVDELMPFAKLMIKEHGEFMPYGGYMETSGEIVHEGATTGEERSKSKDLIEILRRAHKKQAETKAAKATCIVYDLSIAPPSTGVRQDGMAFEIDHQDGYSAVLVYPYQINDKKIILNEPAFGTRGTGEIFGGDIPPR